MRAFVPTVLLAAAPAFAQTCQPVWSNHFGPAGVHSPDPYDSIDSCVVFDGDGPGPHPPALYISGSFTSVGGIPAPGLARWNGAHWETVGAGASASGGSDMVVFNDGSGAALYVIGALNNVGAIIKWNGQAWSIVASGAPLYGSQPPNLWYQPNHLFVLDDDGPGPNPPRLYASRVDVYNTPAFSNFSGSLFRLDPGGWTQLGSGGAIDAATVFNPDGTGMTPPAIYLAHTSFSVAHQIPQTSYASRISRVTPTGVLTDVLTGGNDQARFTSLAAFADNAGLNPVSLYIGGYYGLNAGDAPAPHLSRYIGPGLTPISGGVNGLVSRLQVLGNDPVNPGHGAMYALGSFTSIGGIAANSLARWDGAAWSTLGPGFAPGTVNPLDRNSVNAVAAFDDDGAGPRRTFLYAAGSFTTAGYDPASNIAHWDGYFWEPPGPILNNSVHALLSANLGSGPSLFLGGLFTAADGLLAVSIARWDGQAFAQLLPVNVNNHVDALTLFQGGLIAAGKFTTIGGVPANRIVRYTGLAWLPMGAGFDDNVAAVAVYDSGAGPALYAAGSFTHSGGSSVSHIARWTGQAWASLDSGTDADITSLAVYAGELYAAGVFAMAGGQPSPGIARWNGAAWRPAGTGPASTIDALAVHRGILYAGGTQPGDIHPALVSAWNGQSWFALPAITGPTSATHITALASINESGSAPPVLYASGDFDHAGPTPASRLARWDGTSWSAVGAGLNAPARAITTFGSSVYLGGDFTAAGPQAFWYLASLTPGCPPTCDANCDASTTPPILNIADFTCFLNRFSSGDPYANCDGSTVPPVLNIADFLCFLNKFSAGCP